MARLTDNLLVETVVGRQGIVVDVDVKNKAAGLLTVAHDNTMGGNGTPDDPLRVDTDVIATKEDLSDKADKTEIYTVTRLTITLQDNSIFNFTDDALATLSISVPETINADFACQVNFSSGTTATAFTAPDTIKWAGDDIVSGAFVPVANKRYAILFYSDGSNLRAVSQGVE